MKRRRRDESGFALLLVFLMAASIATMLYMQLPRAAFEAQRGKEELLQDRGEQYIRAIQLYVAKWRNYPPNLDALERSNNIRYLRRRYKDPMTGKDEWRAVHVNGAGQLTDSIVQKAGEQKKETPAVFVSELPTVGATTGTSGEAGQNVALRKRPSDTAGAPGGTAAGSGGFDPNAPVNPSQFPPVNAYQAQIQLEQQQQQQQALLQAQQQMQLQLGQQQPGQQQTGQQQPGQQQPGQQPGQPPLPINPNDPAAQAQQQAQFQQQMEQQIQRQQLQQQQQQSGLQPQPGFPPASFQGGFAPQQQQQQQQQQQPTPRMPSMPGATPPMGMPGGFPTANAGAPGQQAKPGAGPNTGLDMINKILTTPRASLGSGVPGAPGLQIGGGIAGFASTYEAPSIKLYNERQKYNEWEFVYDMKKDKRLLGAAAAAGGAGTNSNPLGGAPPAGSIPNPMTPNPGMNQGMSPGVNTGQPPVGFGPQNPQMPTRR